MIKVKTFNNSAILKSCTYCVYNNQTHEGYIVEAGDAEPVLSFIKEKEIVVKGIFLTHCHYDHIYGINDFLEALPEIKIFCSEETMKGMHDEDLNMAYIICTVKMSSLGHQ